MLDDEMTRFRDAHRLLQRSPPQPVHWPGPPPTTPAAPAPESGTSVSAAASASPGRAAPMSSSVRRADIILLARRVQVCSSWRKSTAVCCAQAARRREEGRERHGHLYPQALPRVRVQTPTQNTYRVRSHPGSPCLAPWALDLTDKVAAMGAARLQRSAWKATSQPTASAPSGRKPGWAWINTSWPGLPTGAADRLVRGSRV